MRVLVTGGAGFIGSHIVGALLDRGADVVVLDDLSTGRAGNVPPAAQLVEGDVTDEVALQAAVRGCEIVFHDAARRSVQQSVGAPMDNDHVNTHGTLGVLVAARQAGARRVVLASSSSVYGGAGEGQTSETAALTPRSPYAVSKLAGEHYARVFAELYGLETVSLRYFNVYGPRQDPASQYAAVIPLFIDALVRGQPPQVNGDGLQSRDFTYVADAVSANLCAAQAPADVCSGRVYNVARGETHTLLDLLDQLRRVLDVDIAAWHADPLPGDIRHSHADISAAREDLGYRPQVPFADGLARTLAWFKASAQASGSTAG
ncbi:MAG: NAD-dependent epimerase/dehydratase family protein [Jiangellaceae bacterium]